MRSLAEYTIHTRAVSPAHIERAMRHPRMVAALRVFRGAATNNWSDEYREVSNLIVTLAAGHFVRGSLLTMARRYRQQNLVYRKAFMLETLHEMRRCQPRLMWVAKSNSERRKKLGLTSATK